MVTGLSPTECVDVAIRQVRKYVDQGLCTHCALILVSGTNQINYSHLALFYFEEHAE